MGAPRKTANPFQERQRGLTGSVIVFQGQSGTGKSDEASECWLSAGMLFGGVCVALAPTRDIQANVKSYLLGYTAQLDRWRADKRRDGSIEVAARKLDFVRENVLVYSDAVECFERIAELGRVDGGGRPQFSLLIDEGAVARKESDIMGSIGPLMRNLCGIAYITMHRGMAVPPPIRAVLRARVLWRSSDGTGDEDLQAEIDSIPGFKYSPVMGSTPKEEQWYRGIRYMPEGPVSFEYNPNLERRPDWMLLPALPTSVRARVLR
jgi:hypothetical protein